MTIKVGKILAVLAAIEGAAAYAGAALAVKNTAKNPEKPGFWNRMAADSVGTAVSIPFVAASIYLWTANGMDIPLHSHKKKSSDEKAFLDESLLDELNAQATEYSIAMALNEVLAKSNEGDTVDYEFIAEALNRAFAENPKGVIMFRKLFPATSEQLFECYEIYINSQIFDGEAVKETGGLHFFRKIREAIRKLKDGDDTDDVAIYNQIDELADELDVDDVLVDEARAAVKNAWEKETTGTSDGCENVE